MPWNEPGGSGGKDPWGSRNNESGPPDLDEVIRKLQKKLGGLFGGRGGGGGGSASFGASSLITLLIIVLVIWALSGIYIVDEKKRGVVTQLGAYKTITMPGMHWFPRFIDRVEIVDVSSVRSVELGYRQDESLMLTQDENIIDIKFTVQYHVSDPAKYLFNVRDPDATLRQSTESALREVVGKSKMDFVLTGGRVEVAARAQKLLQQILDKYQTGLQVIKLTMQDAQPPKQVQAAFADAVKAREDEERLKNEAQAYANDILPRARGKAARVAQEAQAYKQQVIAEAEGDASRFGAVLAEYETAPAIMRQRLYLDALESVLSRSSKVVVDTKSGNNLLYLPLDKLTKRNGVAEAAAAAQAAASGSKANSGGGSQVRENPRGREVR
jgi:membrane protease subunit HflK